MSCMELGFSMSHYKSAIQHFTQLMSNKHRPTGAATWDIGEDDFCADWFRDGWKVVEGHFRNWEGCFWLGEGGTGQDRPRRVAEMV